MIRSTPIFKMRSAVETRRTNVHEGYFGTWNEGSQKHVIDLPTHVILHIPRHVQVRALIGVTARQTDSRARVSDRADG